MIAHTIFQQLGGRRFVTMTGARTLVDCGNSLMFHIPETKRINHVKIILTEDDLYTIMPIASNKKQVSSSVWLWKIRLNTTETFTMTNLSDAKKSNDLVLKQFKAWVRPFLRVEWN